MNILDQIHYEEIKHNSEYILKISNPSVELLNAAIDYNPRNIFFIKNPSEELKRRAATNVSKYYFPLAIQQRQVL